MIVGNKSKEESYRRLTCYIAEKNKNYAQNSIDATVCVVLVRTSSTAPRGRRVLGIYNIAVRRKHILLWNRTHIYGIVNMLLL